MMAIFDTSAALEDSGTPELFFLWEKSAECLRTLVKTVYKRVMELSLSKTAQPGTRKVDRLLEVAAPIC
jgi:hypothetical protein